MSWLNDGSRRYPWLLLVCLLCSALLAGSSGTAGPASAAPLSPDSFGANVSFARINGELGPSDLAGGSTAGLGLARTQVLKGENVDAQVALAAAAHTRFYPVMGLPVQLAPGDAAAAMALFVTAFAQRYGPGGTLWSQHPELPYLPVLSYEIGNEPNIPQMWVADSTHLHWADPSAYAQVYEASRAALHRVAPNAKAVVGGLADSAGLGVDLQHDEQWLAALTPGTVDAVGYHPYTFFVADALMTQDTQQLRWWMDANGLRGVPVDINEMGACDVTPATTNASQCPPSVRQSSGTWGAFASSFTRWALCTPQLGVENVQAFWWGAVPGTDQNAMLALVGSDLSLTPYGADFLGLSRDLTTNGCRSASATPPSSGGSGTSSGSGGTPPGIATSPVARASMRVRLSAVHRSGHTVRLTVSYAAGSGMVAVIATRGHRHRVPLRAPRRRNATRATFAAALSSGRWTITVTGVPAHGYAVPNSQRREVTIPQGRHG